MKDCTDCIRKNNPEYTKCYCAIYKEHPEKCNYKIRFNCPQTEQAEASSLSDLLSSLLVEEEGYKGDCAKDNPDHWSRGYNNGCLKTVQRIIRKIKMAT